MRHSALFPSILLGLGLAASGCFHKDVATDNADDVASTLIYAHGGDTLVVTKEEIFQASSKESNGGVTHISGYAEYRLSAYDARTGEMKARVPLGEQIEEACGLLGFTPGKVWMFAIDPELGLHYRNPKTLEVVEAWPALSQKPGLKGFTPAVPEWPLISQFYGMEHGSGKVIVTDMKGFRFTLSPDDFSLQPMADDMPRTEWDKGCLSSSAELAKDAYLSMSGSPRASISYQGKESGPELSFLNGQFLLDWNPLKAAQRNAAYLQGLEQEQKRWQDSLAAFKTQHPEINPDQYTGRDYDLRNRFQTMKYAYESAERDLKHALDWKRDVLSSPALSTDGRSIFVHHATTLSDTSHAQLSRLDLQADSTWRMAWTTPLPNIYFNYSKADQAGVFETVYSKGNPSFDYMWAGQTGNYLLLIMQLRMLCLDARSGRVLWTKEL